MITNNLNSDAIEEKFYIKVLLEEADLFESSCWNISSKNGIFLINPKNDFKRNIGNSAQINLNEKQISINNKKLAHNIIQLGPVEGNLKFNNNEYHGSFFIIIHNEKLLLINKVELENYIFSVLKTESWPGWPLEVNKAFAIASRSYVIAKFLETKNSKKQIYHVKNTNKHQTYQGVHISPILQQAVDETKGIVLGYNKKPILAMFDICCGGVIPANIKHVNFAHAPYLARKQACNFCKSYKLYEWQVDYNKKNLEEILKKELPKLNDLKSIVVTQKDRAGLVKQIEIKDKRNRYFLTGKKLYSLLKNVKSFCFSIQKNLDKVTIKGKGFGHHLGICQWGAREMVEQNWDYESVLKFYYPGVSFMKLHHK